MYFNKLISRGEGWRTLCSAWPLVWKTWKCQGFDSGMVCQRKLIIAVQVLVKDERKSKPCKSSGDPHIRTFDRVWVELRTFISISTKILISPFMYCVLFECGNQNFSIYLLTVICNKIVRTAWQQLLFYAIPYVECRIIFILVIFLLFYFVILSFIFNLQLGLPIMFFNLKS